MTTAPRSTRARALLAAGVALGLGLGGWYAAAQLAPGERGVPPIDSSTNLEVTGVKVDVAGRTAEEARQAGWREAQRRGWKILYARAHGVSPAAAPGLPDGTLDGIVAGIEVEQEQIGPHRYIASLGILFDRARTGGLLGGGGGMPRSAPMLVLPIEYDAGGERTFETRTPWQKAWARFRAGGSPVDYVRPVGTGADPLLLNLGQSRRPGRLWWRMLLDQYGAADVLIPEVFLRRAWPGGPVRGLFVARHGPDARLLGQVTLTAPNAEALDAMLDEGVRRIDAIYVEALGSRALAPDPSLTIEEAVTPTDESLLPPGAEDALAGVIERPGAQSLAFQVATPDAAALDAAQAALRGVPGMGATSVTSLAVGGTSTLSGTLAGGVPALRAALAARGWNLEGDAPTLRLRRAAPAAPAGAPPVAGP